MSDGKPEVIAHAPGGSGMLSSLATEIKDATGAACVALVMIDPSGNGGYSVAGPLEAQLPMPDVLEQVARALRTQLAGSVQ
jgi:hypothetical protein